MQKDDDIEKKYVKSNRKLFDLKDPSVRFMNYARWMSSAIDSQSFPFDCLSTKRQINQSLLDKRFIESYKKMSKREQILYFINTVQDAEQLSSQREIDLNQNHQEYGASLFNVQIMIEKRRLQQKVYLDGFYLRGQEMNDINLKYYLMRKSKQVQEAFVLDSIRENIIPHKIKLLFNQQSKRQHFQQLSIAIRKSQKQLIKNLLNNKSNCSMTKKRLYQAKNAKITQQTPGFHYLKYNKNVQLNDFHDNIERKTQEDPQQGKRNDRDNIFTFKDVKISNQLGQKQKKIQLYYSQDPIELKFKNRSMSFGNCSEIKSMGDKAIQRLNFTEQKQQNYVGKVILKDTDKKPKQNLTQSFSELIQIGSIALQIQADQQGQVKLSSQYLSTHFQLRPSINTKFLTLKNPHTNFFLKNQWVQNEKGQIILVDKQCLQHLDSVVSYIIKTFKDNLFAGRNLVNISLPVYIFRNYSHLQEMVRSMRLAPYFLQRARATQDPIQRMKHVICFSISHIVLYFETYKPFNPILGETFQGCIAGCPIYAQQISHHPPISSVLLQGRGYRVHYSIQEKMHSGFNFFIGEHFGIYTVQFDDQITIKFTSPKIKVSGLMFGKREFSVIGDCFFFNSDHLLYSELYFENLYGLFSNYQWKFRDQFQGFIGRVKSQQSMDIFTQTQYKNYNLKDSNCSIRIKKQKIQVISKCKGRIAHFCEFDDKRYYDVNRDMPFQLVQEKYPLHSHSNYRSDIFYRRINIIQRSQQQKQKLEQFQRHDAKIRSKYNKNHEFYHQ